MTDDKNNDADDSCSISGSDSYDNFKMDSDTEEDDVNNWLDNNIMEFEMMADFNKDLMMIDDYNDDDDDSFSSEATDSSESSCGAIIREIIEMEKAMEYSSELVVYDTKNEIKIANLPNNKATI
jgi:hypothetical protein